MNNYIVHMMQNLIELNKKLNIIIEILNAWIYN